MAEAVAHQKQVQTILLEKNKGIATLTINRPKQLNALNTRVLEELDGILHEIEQDTSIGVVLITGAGDKAFVAGADISEMSGKDSLEANRFSAYGNQVFTRLAHLRQPTIAAVNGFALGGGCELALACDIRYASPNARFGQPEVGLGIIPGFGGTQRLARLVGAAKAKELIFSGMNVKAEEASTIGLVNKVIMEQSVLGAAKELAEKILKNAPLAVEKSKEVIDLGLEMNVDHAVQYEAEAFGNLFTTKDQKEGMSAFLDKRKAAFIRD